MKEIHTEKLFYKKYTSCIKFKITDLKGLGVRDNSTIKSIKSLLKESSVDCRTRLDWNITRDKITITFSVYLNDDAFLDRLISTYPAESDWISKPANEQHRERLLNKMHTVFRDKLLFNRFRYKVYLYTGWKRENLKEISEWIATQFQDRHNGRTGDYFFTGSWMLTLYLKNETDLTMVRLSLTDYIKNITRIELTNEVTDQAH